VSSDIASGPSTFLVPPGRTSFYYSIMSQGRVQCSWQQKKEEMDVQWQLKDIKAFDRETMGEIYLIRKDREGWLPKIVRFSVGRNRERFRLRGDGWTGGNAKVSELKANEKRSARF